MLIYKWQVPTHLLQSRLCCKLGCIFTKRLPILGGYVSNVLSCNALTPYINFSYETDNGIAVQESGALRQAGSGVAEAVQGSYSYVSPEGEHVSVNYVADENGYHAEGSHIPTPPPIPEAIARSLAWIAAHPYKADDRVVIDRPIYSPYRKY